MKTTIALALALLTVSAMAHDIEGTMMLKGALKTKVMVNGVKSTCKLKIDKVSNNLEQEDSFGNPAYKAKIEISLDGGGFDPEKRVKLDKKLMIDNMFIEGDKRIVKDLEYKNTVEKVVVLIDAQGRLVETTFPYQNQTVRCVF